MRTTVLTHSRQKWKQLLGRPASCLMRGWGLLTALVLSPMILQRLPSPFSKTLVFSCDPHCKPRGGQPADVALQQLQSSVPISTCRTFIYTLYFLTKQRSQKQNILLPHEAGTTLRDLNSTRRGMEGKTNI